MSFIGRRMLTAGAALCLSASLYAGSAADDIQVKGGYTRAVPPGQNNSAAFLSLTNVGDAEHALVAVESGASKIAELHSHLMEDGMMKMRRVEKIDLPPGARVALEPGGLHIMLIDLTKQLSPGENVEITLVFEDGSRKMLPTPVKTVQESMKHQHH